MSVILQSPPSAITGETRFLVIHEQSPLVKVLIESGWTIRGGEEA